MNVREVSVGEMARLPEYCPHTQPYRRVADESEVREWTARLGPTFEHLHHYCWALLKAMRAETVGLNARDREALYDSAVQECNYVIVRAPNGFVLSPEILYRMGVFLAAKSDYVRALDYLERSRAAKGDYWPPYVEAANLNLRIGRRENALRVIEAGLRAMPDDPRLRDLLRRVSESAPKPSAKKVGPGK